MNSKRRSRDCARWSVVLGLLASHAFAGCAVYDSSLLANQVGAAAGVGGNAGDSNPAGDQAGDGNSGGTGGVSGNSGFAGAMTAGGTPGMDGGTSGGGAPFAGTMNAAGDHSGGAGSSGSAGHTSAGAGGPTRSTASGGSAGAGGSAGMGANSGMAGMPSNPVELSRGKPAGSSSFQAGNDPNRGNDGDLGTKFCPVDGTFPQWWRVDLGATHALSSFSVTFEQPDRKYTYKIETSADDAKYTLQASLSGTGQPQTDKFPPNLSARYVRITVTDAAPGVFGGTTYPTWACFMEFSVLGN